MTYDPVNAASSYPFGKCGECLKPRTFEERDEVICTTCKAKAEEQERLQAVGNALGRAAKRAGM